MNKPKRDPERERVGRGAPGNYALNQHAPRYADRRTKRNRTRSDQERKAIEQEDTE